VSTFIPNKLLDLIVARLKTITRAAAYQTQPEVTTDPVRAMSEIDKSLLLVVPGSLEFGDPRTGSEWAARVAMTIDVYGQQPTGTGEPWEECHKLMQDTWFCLANYYSTLATALGVGGAVSFGDMTMTLVPLDDGGLTIFHIPLNVQYQVRASTV